MPIPTSEFNNILANWLSPENVYALIEKADEIDWKPIHFNEPYIPRGPEIIVDYIKND